MKYLNLILLLSFTTFASLIEISGESGDTVAVFKYVLDEYSVDTINYRSENFSQISSKESQNRYHIKGSPALPYFVKPIYLKDNTPVTIDIISIKDNNLSILPPLPSKGNIKRSQNPANIIAKRGAIYSSNEFFPKERLSITKPYIIANEIGLSITINPFKYNGLKRELTITKEITFAIIKKRDFRSKIIASKTPYLSPLKRETQTTISTIKNMVVLTTEKYRESAERFIAWKNSQGIKSELLIYPKETGTGSESIKSYLKSKYDKNIFSYLTIIGDWEDVPSKLVDYGRDYGDDINDTAVSSDMDYGCLVGDDYFPEVFVGRFSVNSVEEANLVIDKNIKYVEKPDTSINWFNRTISIGSNEGSPADYDWIRDSLNTSLKTNGFAVFDTFYQGLNSFSEEDVSKKIESGASIINYMGHGDWIGFGFSYGFWFDTLMTKNLRNIDRLPVLIPLACQFGAFKGRTVAAEFWQKTDSGGAIIVMGSTPLQDWTPPQVAMVDMNKNIGLDNSVSMGDIFYKGLITMLKNDPNNAERSMRTFAFFGDPSLVIYTDKPKIRLKDIEILIDSKDININSPINKNAKIKIYSINGRLVINKNLQLIKGLNSLNIGKYNIGSGVYIFTIEADKINLVSKVFFN